MIAVALDQTQTRTELVPFLGTFLDRGDCHDEVLLNLSAQLGLFLPFVGGSEHVQIIFELLEKLAATEDTAVRETTINSFKLLAGCLNSNQIEKSFMPMIHKLSEAEWFTSKCSSTGLFAVSFLRSLNIFTVVSAYLYSHWQEHIFRTVWFRFDNWLNCLHIPTRQPIPRFRRKIRGN